VKSVALVGPDGAGKSTIAHELVRALPIRAQYLYMGVNLQTSAVMLPTTRLAMALKRRRKRRPQMMAGHEHERRAAGTRRGITSEAYSGLRLIAWLGEEWYRALVAVGYNLRGYLIVYDRHYLYDFLASDAASRPRRGMADRAHGRLLRRFYPRADLVVYLDAPAELLYARKGEHTTESLERRRRRYLALHTVASDFVVVDSSRPLATVVAQVTALVEDRLR